MKLIKISLHLASTSNNTTLVTDSLYWTQRTTWLGWRLWFRRFQVRVLNNLSLYYVLLQFHLQLWELESKNLCCYFLEAQRNLKCFGKFTGRIPNAKETFKNMLLYWRRFRYYVTPPLFVTCSDRAWSFLSALSGFVIWLSSYIGWVSLSLDTLHNHTM